VRGKVRMRLGRLKFRREVLYGELQLQWWLIYHFVLTPTCVVGRRGGMRSLGRSRITRGLQAGNADDEDDDTSAMEARSWGGKPVAKPPPPAITVNPLLTSHSTLY
jgi:hypothetical protein